MSNNLSVIELTHELIRSESSEKEISCFVKDYLIEYVERMKTNNHRYHVVAYICTRERGLTFNGHLDTVRAERRALWMHDPPDPNYGKYFRNVGIESVLYRPGSLKKHILQMNSLRKLWWYM